MAIEIDILGGECDIGERTLPNGHFWRMRFVDAATGNAANVTFTDAAFFDFLGQIEDIRRQLRN